MALSTRGRGAHSAPSGVTTDRARRNKPKLIVSHMHCRVCDEFNASVAVHQRDLDANAATPRQQTRRKPCRLSVARNRSDQARLSPRRREELADRFVETLAEP